jgi:DNA-binding transcriptional regulator YiaG
MPTWLRWDPSTVDHLDERVIPDAPGLRQIIETICGGAKLTTADFADILGRDRRNVASWKNGTQQPRPEIFRMIQHLQHLIERLQKVDPGFPAAVLSPLYGHPYRGRIVELIRSGETVEAERLAVTPTADLDLQGREVMTMTVSDYVAALADRQKAPHALLSASEGAETDEDRASLEQLQRSRRMRRTSVRSALS